MNTTTTTTIKAGLLQFVAVLVFVAIILWAVIRIAYNLAEFQERRHAQPGSAVYALGGCGHVECGWCYGRAGE